MDLPHQDYRTRWYNVLQNKFLAATLTTVVLGIIAGVIIKIFLPSLPDEVTFYIAFPGEVLMRMLCLVSVSLIVTTVIKGLFLVMMLKPGVVSPEDESDIFDIHGVLDLVRNMVPPNLIQACFQQKEVEMVGHFIERPNTLGLIVCAYVFGLVLKDMDERGRIISDVICIINKMTKYVTNLILCFYPVGVLFLVTRYVTEVPDWDSLYTFGVFVVVVVVGHIIHGAIFLPVLYLLTVRQNPWGVLRGAAPALWTALLTASSSATMARTVECCEQRIRVKHRIVRFMLPLATHVNMDGTVLFEVIAAVFVAQLNDIHLSLYQIITLGVTSAISSIKGLGIPSTGAVTTLFVLSAVGLPGTEVAILVIVKWLLDVFNTVINVWGDCIGLAIINQLSTNEMEEWENQDANRRRMEAEALSDDSTFPESSESFHST
ncbi:hypothetical protein INR49_018277 [Caranx melampygus]|nr:hypothetical protein INR49_018277 [Caranx melampygus]